MVVELTNENYTMFSILKHINPWITALREEKKTVLNVPIHYKMCSNFRIVNKKYILELRKRGGAFGALGDDCSYNSWKAQLFFHF